MWRMVSVLLLLAAGCGKDKDPTTTGFGDDDDDGPDEETAHTAEPEPDRKFVAEVRFRAYVAWDAALGQVVTPVIDGDPNYISVYVISLYEEGWSDADEDSSCIVRVYLEGTTLAEGVAQEGFLWGLDIPEGLDGKTIDSDCDDKEFDTLQWGGEDTAVYWGSFDWHLRFGGTRSAELEDWLTPDTPTADFDLAHYAAGGWWTDTAGLETEVDSNYWYAYAMDDAHNVDFDTRLLDFQMTNINGEPVTAYYYFDQNVVWTLEPPTTE